MGKLGLKVYSTSYDSYENEVHVTFYCHNKKVKLTLEIFLYDILINHVFFFIDNIIYIIKYFPNSYSIFHHLG